MRIYSLASGSKGNSFLFVSKEAKILIDCGISCKSLKEKLSSLGLNLNEIDAILITHEHVDHIKGLFVVSKSYNGTIVMSKSVHKYLLSERLIYNNIYTNIICNNSIIRIKDIIVTPIKLSHDSVDCHGYILENESEKALYLTDTGYIDEKIFEKLCNLDYAIVESNHDVEMLKYGPYPMYLQRRIKSKEGHLSNEQAGEFCEKIVRLGVKKIMLAHLSEKNNTKSLAKATIEKYVNENVSIVIADQYEIVRFVDYD